MYGVALLSVAILVLLVLSSVFQFVEFNRTHVIDSETEEPLCDTQTRFTAAFVLSAFLQPSAILFSGAAFAYIFARGADSKSYLGAVNGIDVALFSFLVILAIVFLGVPGFWYADAELRNEANELHSAADEEWDWSPEGSVPYAIQWFTSPLGSWVRGTNIFILLATCLQYIIIVSVFFLQRKTRGERDTALASLTRDGGKLTRGRRVIIVLLDILTVLLVLGALSHTLMAFLAEFTSELGEDQFYWMMFNSSVHLSLVFFVAGWCLYFFLSRGWWTYPAQARGEAGWSLAATLVTIVASGTALGFSIFHLISIYEDCQTTVFSITEGDSELKIGVCNLIAEERQERTAALFWHRFNAWWLIVATAGVLLTSAVSLFARPQTILHDKKAQSGSEDEALLRGTRRSSANRSGLDDILD